MTTLRNTFSKVEANRDLVFDLLRIYLGLGLLARGVLFLVEPSTFLALAGGETASWVASPGILYTVSALHIAGGAMMIAGYYTRLAALVQIPVLLGAVIFVHPSGFFSATQSFEFSTLVLFLLVLVFLHGAGRWSVDSRRDSGLPAFRRINDRLDGYSHVAFELLRIYLGVGLFIRGAVFISNSAAFFDLLGPSSSAWLTSVVLIHYVALAHLVGGVMMMMGLATRIAALIQLPVLVGAVFIVHLGGGLFSASQSFEFAALVLFLLVLMLLHGSGRWSLDYYVFEREVPDDDELRMRAGLRHEPSSSHPPAPEELLTPGRTATPVLSCPIYKRCPVVESGGPAVARTHEWVRPRVRYGLWGGLHFLVGITGAPREIVYRCNRCGQVIDRIEDSHMLEQYRYHQPDEDDPQEPAETAHTH